MDNFTPSQHKLYIDIENEIEEYTMYKNYILRGVSGSGKSYLLRKLAEDKGYKYIKFEECLGKNFFKNNDYRVIDEMILLKYIEIQIDNQNMNETIIIDNLNSIFNSIKEKNRIINLISGFLRRKYRNKYILVMSDLYIQDENLKKYNRIFNLEYTAEDNEFLWSKNNVTEISSSQYKNGHYYMLSK